MSIQIITDYSAKKNKKNKGNNINNNRKNSVKYTGKCEQQTLLKKSQNLKLFNQTPYSVKAERKSLKENNNPVLQKEKLYEANFTNSKWLIYLFRNTFLFPVELLWYLFEGGWGGIGGKDEAICCATNVAVTRGFL